jgi:hypothetical protein
MVASGGMLTTTYELARAAILFPHGAVKATAMPLSSAGCDERAVYVISH